MVVGWGGDAAGSNGEGGHLHLGWDSGLSIPWATRSPPHQAPPPQNLPLLSPPGKNLAVSGLSEQRDAPFSYHGNLGKKFLKFRQGNFSSPLRFRYRSTCCSPGMRRPALLLHQQGGISEIRNAGAARRGSERLPSLHPISRPGPRDVC